MDLKHWLRTYGLTILLSGGIAGILIYVYTVNTRIPELTAQLKEYRQEQRENHERLRDEIRESQADMSKRLDLLASDLMSVRGNVIRLCSRDQQIGRTCNPEELAGAVTSVAQVPASRLRLGKIRTTSGSSPQLSKGALEAISGLSKFPATSQIQTNADIASAIAWSSLAKDAKWSAKGQELAVKFANGSATFIADNDVQEAALTGYAAQLNQLSQSSSAAFDRVESVRGDEK